MCRVLKNKKYIYTRECEKKFQHLLIIVRDRRMMYFSRCNDPCNTIEHELSIHRCDTQCIHGHIIMV